MPRLSTPDVEWKPSLPTTGENRFYRFTLYAFNLDDIVVGKFMVSYDDGYGWDYRFRVGVRSMVNIHPNTLNLKSRGQWITAYVELPEGYDLGAIDISTVKLNNEIPAESHPTEIGDYDDNGIPDLMVKFDRMGLMALLSVGEATLTITGEVNGIPFEGVDTVRVLLKG